MATANRPRRTLEARAGETGRRANARGVRAARRALASAEAPREVPRREPRGTTSRPERGEGARARRKYQRAGPSLAPSWRSRVHRPWAGRQKAPDALGFGAALLGAHVGRRVARARGARGARSRQGDVRGGARGRHPRQAPSKARGRRVRAGAKSVRLARPPSPRRASPDAPNAPPRPLPRAAHLSLAARLDRRPRTIHPVSHASPHPRGAFPRRTSGSSSRTRSGRARRSTPPARVAKTRKPCSTRSARSSRRGSSRPSPNARGRRCWTRARAWGARSTRRCTWRARARRRRPRPKGDEAPRRFRFRFAAENRLWFRDEGTFHVSARSLARRT